MSKIKSTDSSLQNKPTNKRTKHEQDKSTNHENSDDEMDMVTISETLSSMILMFIKLIAY